MPRSKENTYLLVDMSSLRFSRSSDLRSIDAKFLDNTPFLSIEVEPTNSNNESVFLLLEEALRTTIKVDSVDTSIALYNPISFQVAIKPTPETIVYSTGEPIAIKPSGSLVTGDDKRIVLNGEILFRVNPTYQDILSNILQVN